jgi:phage terminase Nu1 subunit (DNA packaging protein)
MKRNDPDNVSSAELGKWLGLSQKAVSENPAMVRVSRGRYALKASIAAYATALRAAATGRGSPTAIERARLIKAQADAAELKNATACGEMLDAAAVEREWSAVLRTVRSGCLAIPSRVAGRLPHLTRHDVSEIDAEMRAALTELGSGT